MLGCFSAGVLHKQQNKTRKLLHNKEGKTFSIVQSCIRIAQDSENVQRKLKKTREVSFDARWVTIQSTLPVTQAVSPNVQYRMCNARRVIPAKCVFLLVPFL